MAKLSASLALAASLFAVASAQLTILEPGGPDLWWSKFSTIYVADWYADGGTPD